MDPTLRHNAREFYRDIFWYGVLAGSAQAFLAVYAARLGASSLMLGLLTAGPAVANLVISLPAGRWLQKRSVLRAVVEMSLWHRAGYLALIALPALFPPLVQSWLLAALVVVMSVPGTVLAIGFNAMFADLVPPEWRGHVVGRRNALLALSMMGTSLAAGFLLDHPALSFPGNYQLVFAVGTVGAFMSSHHLTRLRPMGQAPPRAGLPLFDLARPGMLRFGDVVRVGAAMRFLTRGGSARLLRLDLLRGPFGPFIGVLFLFYVFQYVPVPIFPLMQVNVLHLTDGAISIGNALFNAATLIVSTRLDRVTRTFGHHRVLAGSAVLYGLFPLLVGLAQDATLYWAAALVGGAVWGLTGGALVTRLMERASEADRPAHMALHNLALNLGILGGSLLGSALGDALGVRTAILASAGLRFLAGLLLLLWG